MKAVRGERRNIDRSLIANDFLLGKAESIIFNFPFPTKLAQDVSLTHVFVSFVRGYLLINFLLPRRKPPDSRN